jgi:hypothetical protein
MPTYINKDGTNATVTSSTNIYARNDSGWSRVNNIYVRNDTSWVQVYQWDTVAPTGGGIASIVWNQSLPGFTINYNSTADADSGIASYTLQYSSNGSSYSNVSAISAAGGAYSYSVTSGNRGALHYFRTVAVDNVGLTTTSTASSAYSKPLGTFTIDPGDGGVVAKGDSFGTSPAQWRGLSAEAIVRIGYSGANAYGAFFYNTDLADVCLGYSPDSGSFFIQRSPAGSAVTGSSGTYSFRLHNLPSNGNPSLGATFYGNTVTNGAGTMSGDGSFTTVTMDSTWFPLIANGTGRGIALTAHSAVGSGGASLTTTASVNGQSGRITLVFN